ncbi:thioredoxin-disulfide reductase [Candidatus Uhrbacteria bacterium CG_4_9_14_3_um_filter_36_7]|uniref:Thioredoxin reductase n=1 Tax=Candidatus Uhrbacteria bacterium CG_4_9_14_3_um_filter_36_7 TaxID=1975033 RepID=A0A2M7XHV9_9BACT|nr:MAG: thioredoxin-disulfide reductase [Candidatus Uhrbacteria bacterium CG_4_9_14_3_um_filter_36_7]
MSVQDVLIIGSGPAGYTAAIYAGRAGLSSFLFEGGEPGGQLMTTTEVENFPGFPLGILGPELMQQYRKQAERFGTHIQNEIITSIDFVERHFVLHTSQNAYEGSSVIIATGASSKWLHVPGEEIYRTRGVSVCATCDGFFFKGKNVGVVGGGDAALEEALFLARFVNRVTIFVRRDELRASKIMQERAKENPKIIFSWNTEVLEIIGDGQKLTKIRLVNNQTQEQNTLDLDGLFIAIGHKPNSEIFQGILDLDPQGYIKCESGTTKTSKEGIFAAGDVIDHRYRQAITAAGMGCMAALDAERWLSSQQKIY